MIKVEYTCLECEENITNPLCVSCFEKQVFALVSEKNVSNTLKISMQKEIASVIEEIKSFSFSPYKCVICRRKMNDLCTYCLMKQTSNVIEKYLSQDDAEILFNLGGKR